LIALLCLLILAVRIGLNFLRQLKYQGRGGQTDPPLKAMLSISLIAGAIHACLSGVLIMPASQVATVLIAGWALSLSGNVRLLPKTSALTFSILITGVFITCAMLVFAIGELTQLSVRTSYSVQYGPMMPRFWQDGRVCEYNYTNP
jgi:hypothetical protein